ncbi:hypothetical protein ACWKWU_13265 [Chitinophaga lutea]
MNANERKTRAGISAGLCIVIGLAIGFMIKKVHIGLLIGLALGLLGGGVLSKRN